MKYAIKERFNVPVLSVDFKILFIYWLSHNCPHLAFQWLEVIKGFCIYIRDSLKYTWTCFGVLALILK